MEYAKKSIIRVLILFRLLLEGPKTNAQLIEEFSNLKIKLNRASINNYIETLKNNGVEIKSDKIKNRNLYSIEKTNTKLLLSKQELLNIKQIKKRLFAYKNHKLIKVIMRLFYKIAIYIPDIETRKAFIDFGYYSKINWMLLDALESCIKNQNVIEIEYILPSKSKKDFILHPQSISVGHLSDRLYLNCILGNSSNVSHLPVDKIFLIKKIHKNKVFNKPEIKTCSYKLANTALAFFEPDPKEKIIEQSDEYIKIEALLEDEFYTIQRLLSFCPYLYEISDLKLKNKVVEKLNLIKASYEAK